MAFNNVPVNGWPQIKDLEKLDALAKQIEDMPTFSSSDRAWLDEWEDKLPELPEDPETDGVKVLTATTEDGETVKSWEDPASGGFNYSTTEQNTGRKWVDNKDIYVKVYNLETPLSLASQTWTDSGFDGSDIDTIVNAFGTDINGTYFNFYAQNNFDSKGKIGFLQTRNSGVTITKFVLEYTKSST